MVQLLSPLLLLSRLRREQWKSASEIESMQGERLRQVLSYCSKNVGYYKGLDMNVRSIEELPNLPLLRKSDIKSARGSLLSSQFPRNSLVRSSTSGSTGTPLEIFHHPSEAHHGPTLELFHLTECGVRPFDVQAHIMYRSSPQRIFQRVGLFRRKYLPVYKPEAENLEALARMRPPVLMCNPSYLVPLAYENLRSGTNLSIGKIFSFSEVLSPKARELITKSFSCELYDMYGVVETSWVGWECEKGSMHLHSGSLIAEIINDDGQPAKRGEYGRIALTTLWKRSMPLIRYLVGDRTALGPKCSCGRGLHTLKPIQGRDDDFIVLPSGRVASARILDVGMRHLPGVLLFQALQEEAGSLEIKVVPEGRVPPAEIQKKFLRELEKSFNEPIRISLEFRKSIPRGRTGKIRSVISKVRPDLPL